jgi:hypothetical protein
MNTQIDKQTMVEKAVGLAKKEVEKRFINPYQIINGEKHFTEEAQAVFDSCFEEFFDLIYFAQ